MLVAITAIKPHKVFCQVMVKRLQFRIRQERLPPVARDESGQLLLVDWIGTRGTWIPQLNREDNLLEMPVCRDASRQPQPEGRLALAVPISPSMGEIKDVLKIVTHNHSQAP